MIRHAVRLMMWMGLTGLFAGTALGAPIVETWWTCGMMCAGATICLGRAEEVCVEWAAHMREVPR